MYSKILVPLDGSDFGEHAIPMALSILRRGPSCLHLVHVTSSLVPEYANIPASGQLFDAAVIERELREDMAAYLAGVSASLPQGVNSEVALLMGASGESIAAYAAEQRVDIIVMATHGRGGINRAWLGSVAESVVHAGPAPVLLVRPAENGKENRGVPLAAGPVLVPLQDMEFSGKIIPHAQAFAMSAGGRVVLLDVIIPLERRARVIEARLPDDEQRIVSDAINRDRAYLEPIAADLRANGLDVTVRVIESPSAAAAILDEANSIGASAIAMATHARRGVSRLLFGSVANKVVRGSTGPVLLFRPD
jgi:nucleotide-binding universal stress UspA family protein